MSDNDIPVVLTFAGTDPTGGAGIQADIEAISSMGCHAAAVVTTITVQDTSNVLGFEPVASPLLIEQARAVLEDMPVHTIKIGMIGSVENVEVIHTLLNDYPDIPVVLDPVLRAGGGSDLANDELMGAMIDLLFPMTSILTPNSHEARRLAPEADTLDACAQEILAAGCELVLITGTHENTATVDNTLYGNRRRLETYSWERLPHSYHGSGCTLASGIAGLLAQGIEPLTAIHEAQEYTWETLKHGYRLGMGQYHPNRFFWARGGEE
jgi:hydroxymethylpyrimidine/phosphomethylpyrimidine kinase